jgi:ABC-type multidrug transport system fused ATPase/permease subunit
MYYSTWIADKFSLFGSHHDTH